MQASPHDFMLSGDGPPTQEKLRTWLEPHYRAVPEGNARTVRRAWLDTFDWRLYRAGLTLEHVTARGTGEITLTGQDGQRISVPAGGVRWPALAAALPPGPLRDRLGRVTGWRALIVTARAVSTVRTFRALNADEKTVAWLTTDQASPVQPAGAGLPARLSVTAMRGYQAQANRIARRLAAVGGAVPVSEPLFHAVLAAGGRRPGGYTQKITVELDPAMPGRLALAAVLLQLLSTLEANVDGVVRDIDTEFLHDLRVCTRRTRTALKLGSAVLPAGLAGEFRGEFKWLGDATTPTRDLDVYLQSYGTFASRLAAGTPAELAPFHDHLARRRAAAQRRLARALRSARFAGLTSKWRESLTGFTPPRRGPTAARLASGMIGKAHRRVITLGSTITASSPAEALHELRKDCKELRYGLEFFASLSEPQAHAQAVRELKGLQDCLGTFQDCQVQQRGLRTAAAEMMAAGDTPATALLAMGDVAAQLARREQRARAAFAAGFARLASHDSRARFAALTAGAGR